MRTYDELENKIGYHFKDPKLLCTALTHSSYANEHSAMHISSNERLEYVGDSLLDMVISLLLYNQTPPMNEGEMTKLRAGLVCEQTLCKLAKEYDLGSYLLLGKGEEIGGGRQRPSILADTFESVIAAIYFDGGMQPIMRFIEDVFRPLMINQEVNNSDYKTLLQEYIQNKTRHSTPVYYIVEQTGPDHDKTFTVEVEINGKRSGTGTGKSKKSAEQNAAKSALETYKIKE